MRDGGDTEHAEAGEEPGPAVRGEAGDDDDGGEGCDEDPVELEEEGREREDAEFGENGEDSAFPGVHAGGCTEGRRAGIRGSGSGFGGDHGGGGDDGGGFDAHDMGPESGERCAGGAEVAEFIVCPAAFGSDQDADQLGSGGGVRGAGRVGDDDTGIGGDCGVRGTAGAELERPGPSGLLGGFGGDAGEAREFAFAGVDDGAGGKERAPRGGTDLSQAVDHVFEAFALGRGGPDLDAGARRWIDGQLLDVADEEPLGVLA